MTDTNPPQRNRVTLDLEDLLEVVSKSNSKPIMDRASYTHATEGEDLKKAWFTHMLVSMEKLNDLIESIRRVDLVNLREEMKDEIRDIDNKIIKAEDELKLYKKDVICPMNDKLITITVKLGLWGILGGLIGSGLTALMVYLIKEYFFKP